VSGEYIRNLKLLCMAYFEILEELPLENSMTLSFRPHYGSGVDSPSNRNEYQEYFLGVKAAGV